MPTGTRKTMTDFVVPGYKRLKAHGATMVNEVDLVEVNRACGSSTVTIGPHPQWGMRVIKGHVGAYYEMAIGSVSHSSRATLTGQSLLVKAYAKMNEAGMSGIETLHDLNTTVAMLRKPFQGAGKLLKKMELFRAKRLGKTAASIAKASSDTWLEYRYGWKPLCLDVEMIIDRSHKIRGRTDRRRLVARAGGQETLDDIGSFTASGVTAPPGLDQVSGKTRFRTEIRTSAGVIYDLASQTTIDQLREMLGGRPSDIPSGIWECIPYSFVVDWFVNVGDWIKAVTPNPAVSVINNWITTCTMYEETDFDLQAQKYVSNSPPTTYKASVSGGYRTTRSYKRVAGQPMASHPAVTALTVSPLHSVDALSLTVQSISTRLGSFKH
jgi:hypothetical protein